MFSSLRTDLGYRYSEMSTAAYLRGTYLDDLGESLNNATISATNYVTQARNTAVSFSFAGGLVGL